MPSYRKFKKQFKSKQQKAEKEKNERKAISALEKHSEELAKRRTEYLLQAEKAYKNGDRATYDKYVSLIKNVLFQKAQIDDMIANYKMARDLRDMGKAREGFSETLDDIADDVIKSSIKTDLKKTEKKFTKGVYKNGEAAENLQHLLATNGSAFSSYAERVSDVSDGDLKDIIEGELKKDDADVDARLSEFESELLGESEKPAEKIAEGGRSFPREPIPAEPARGESSDEKSVEKLVDVPVKTAKPAEADTAAPERGKDSPESKILEEGGADGEYKFDWDNLPVIGFGDIAGLDSVKEIVQVKVILPLTRPDLSEGYVKKNGGGLLLYGPPGTGKTMIAAAIANEIGAKFCSVKPSDLLHQGAGNTEKAVRALFAEARSYPCAVIYFDEMDSIAPKSTKSQYARQLRSEFLAQLQGIESYGKDTGNILFLIAATNKPWDIDSAFIRPGRFGTRVYVGLPDEAARRYMIEHRIEKIRKKGIVKIDGDLDIDGIVERSNGFNGSDVTNLFDRVEEISMIRSITSGEKTISNADFNAAFTSVSSTVQREDIEKLLEWKGANE